MLRDDLEVAAGLPAVLLGGFDHVGDQAVAFGIGEGDIHAEAGHEADDALRHRERLAIAGRVGPGHRDLFATQIFERAEMVLQLQQVGHRLGGMVDVALEADDAGALVEHALIEPFLNGPGDFAHVAVALAEIHVVADADDLRQERDHVRRLAHGFAVGDLRFALVEFREARPSALTAEAKLNRVRVELSRKIEMARPVSKDRNGLPALCMVVETLGDQQ